MSLVCQGCTAAYAKGAPQCPQCGSTDAVEQGAEPMRLPYVELECDTDGCRWAGRRARVPVHYPAPGLVAVPPHVLCTGCGREPRVRRGWPIVSDMEREAEQMAKVTVHGGPSNDNPPDLGTPVDEEAKAAALAEQEEQGAGQESGAAAEPEPAAAPGPDPGPAGQSPELPARPRLSANRGEWEAYAVGLGLDAEKAAKMTKTDLQEWADRKVAEQDGDQDGGNSGTVATADVAEATVTRGDGSEG